VRRRVSAAGRTDQWRKRIQSEWLRLRSRTPREAKRRLWQLAKALEQNRFEWASAMLLAYLSGHADSLDAAFGVSQVAKRGAPRRRATEAKLRRVLKLRLARKTWAEIARVVGGDERELRRLYTSRRPQLIAEEIAMRLSAKPRRGRGANSK
jgi:hypothetical protein